MGRQPKLVQECVCVCVRERQREPSESTDNQASVRKSRQTGFKSKL